jgi:hypothetical protein
LLFITKAFALSELNRFLQNLKGLNHFVENTAICRKKTLSSKKRRKTRGTKRESEREEESSIQKEEKKY